MKEGISFDELTGRVARLASQRHDFYAATNEMRLNTETGESRLVTSSGEFGLRDSGHLHLSELTGIDRRYYQRMLTQAPALLANNVNHWLARSGPKPRLVRALDTTVRAIASVRYATLDNDDLLSAVEPIICDLGAKIESCALTNESLTIKLVTPKLQGEVKKGDPVQAGLVIKNSEVRAGALSVQPLIFRLVCTNGLISGGANGKAASRRHIGRDWRSDNDYFGVVSENVERAAWERGVWQNLAANIRQAISTDSFQTILERLTATTRLQSTLEPEQIVERLESLGPEYRLGPEIQAQVVGHLHADGYDGTLWHVINGITRAAQDVSSFEVATSLEELGGRLSALTQRQWDRLVSAN